MNEELQKAIAGLILGFTDSLHVAKDFALEQSPEVIQQLLMWKVVSGVLVAVVAIVAIVVSVWLVVKMHQMRPKERGKHNSNIFWDGWECLEPSLSVVGACISSLIVFSVIVSVCMGLVGISTAVQIWIAPKVYLIEYAASLTR